MPSFQQWIAFAPLHEAANAFYCHPNESNNNIAGERNETIGESDCDVETWSSQIFQIVGVLTGLFGMFITDRYGIRIAVSIYPPLFYNIFSYPYVRHISEQHWIYWEPPFGLCLPCHCCTKQTDYQLYILVKENTVRYSSLLSRSNNCCNESALLPVPFTKSSRILVWREPTGACQFTLFHWCHYFRIKKKKKIALANPFGVLVGSIIPVIFVSSNSFGEEHANILDSQILYLVCWFEYTQFLYF